MAVTQEYYNLKARLPRYTTKLNPFSSGMYLTNQLIPEGYAKTMINFDIDDTGSHIRPRKGRIKTQAINYTSKDLGAVSLTDYVYSYNKDNTEVEDIKDIVMSYGKFVNMANLVEIPELNYNQPVYLASMLEMQDSNLYTQDEEGNWNVEQEGTITEVKHDPFWNIYFDKTNERFEKIINSNIGFVTARTIRNAYAFEKPFESTVGRPIGTVLNNEIIAFTGDKLTYNHYLNNAERNELLNFNTPNLTKLIVTKEDVGYTIKRQLLEPRKLNPIEAASGGYNILDADPYVFEDEKGGSVSILGMLLYSSEDKTKPIFTPKLGQSLVVRVYYQYPTAEETLKYKVEILDTTTSNSDWEVLSDFKETVKAGEPIYYELVPKTTSFLIRVTLRSGDDTATEYPFFRSITCGDSSYDKLENVNFDLSTCKGMFSWRGVIGVYGVDNAKDTIFFSDVEDPSYFPFPYNVLSFENEILAVKNYLDYLLVITVDTIWLVTSGSTVAASVQKKILTNINIPEIDAINLVVLKDQIFFKTDTQFYVLKPNKYTSDSTDLKNYVNSTAISNLTKDFKEHTVDLLNKVYRNIWQDYTKELRKQIRFVDFSVLDTNSVIRDEEVHYIYTIVPELTDNIILDRLNLHLVYNTLTRSWRMYFVAIGMSDVGYNPVLYRNKQSGSYYEFFTYSNIDESFLVISKQTDDVVTDNIVNEDWELTKYYDNYNYLDTGNIALDDTFTKRFREVQFNLMNIEPTDLRFYICFKLDGQEVINSTKYEVQHITDPDDPEYGLIYITPVEHANLDLYGTTILADTELEEDYWSVDLSKFPELDISTVRFNLKGRGRRGAVQLLNNSLKRYELSNLIWVYRIMNAR